ncbi:MAG: S-layer homology domain-containing protein, partial [Monoglobales bacterium]
MKKILLLFLAAVIAFSCISVNAAEDNLSLDKIQIILSQLEIMRGYPDGNFYPERPVTRAEFAKIAVMASSYRDYVASGMNTSPFVDVQYTHWAAPYVKLASVNRFITGYPDSTFRPEDNVLMEEAVTVVVKMLGYDDSDFAASWPYGQIGVAKNTGLLNNISTARGDYMSRGDVAQLIYNTLRAKPKAAAQPNAEFISSIGFNLIENVTILATAKEDSSVGSNKVSTSAGTFKINEYFDHGIVGSKGYILVSNTNELLTFVPNNLSTVNYTVYSVLENEIVAYKDGGLVSLKLSDNLTAYYKLQTSTMGQMKKSLDTGYLLSVAYDTSGNPEYVTINDNALDGPVTILTDGLTDSFGLSSSAIVMRDGNRSNLSAIAKYDIVYYSKTLDMIWAYSKKVTGTYEEAYPNRDAVSSVKISGKTYTIESAQAAAAL